MWLSFYEDEIIFFRKINLVLVDKVPS